VNLCPGTESCKKIFLDPDPGNKKKSKSCLIPNPNPVIGRGGGGFTGIADG
jgi:hypothetical protein